MVNSELLSSKRPHSLPKDVFLKDTTEGQADQGSHAILIDLGTSLSGLCSLKIIPVFPIHETQGLNTS